jgi:hypothetical protein
VDKEARENTRANHDMVRVDEVLQTDFRKINMDNDIVTSCHTELTEFIMERESAKVLECMHSIILIGQIDDTMI